MAGLCYVGLIHRNSDGFGLVFPDLPGCVTVGKTLDQLAHRAREALALHLSTMVDDGDPLPPATLLDHIATDPEYPEIGRILVEGRIANRALRVNITLQESLLTEIDKAAEQRGLSRSGFLAEAARHMLSAN